MVMFYATGRCNGGISAMVIGEDKPLTADDLSCAASAKNDDGVLD